MMFSEINDIVITIRSTYILHVQEKKTVFLLSYLAVSTVTTRLSMVKRNTYSLRLSLFAQLTSKYITFTNLKRKENIILTIEK
jgi:hypothetical protein